MAKEIRDEHRNALDWLNNATQGNIDFFGVEVELLRIGGSPAAPNFKVVAGPTESGGTVGPNDRRAPSEREQRYRDFFVDMLERIKARPPRVTNATKVGYQSWFTTPSGKGGFTFGLAFVRGQKFQIELYIDMGNRETNKQVFDEISLGEVAINEELGATLDWQRLDQRRASRVAWYWDEPVTVMESPAKIEELKTWAVDNYFRFRDVIGPYLENLPTIFVVTGHAEQEPLESNATDEEHGVGN